MANEKIEIDIVLADGSVGKAFASLPKAASDAAQKASQSLGGIEKSFGGISNGIGSLKAGFLALGAAISAGLVINKLSGFIGDAVQEAQAGEESLNNLANALRSAGTLSTEAIDQFKDFANQTQKNTTLTDDQVLSLSALARNYARTNDEAIKLTQAAIQLSAARGIDLNTAVDQLGGTLQGVSGILGKTIPGFKALSQEALKSGEALDLVLERFGSSAESKINTYAGSIAQLKNEFSDFLEGIGNLIIRSPALTAVFTEVANIFKEFSATVSGFTSSNQDVLGPIIKQTIRFALVFNDFVIKPFEVLGNAVKLSFNLIKTEFNLVIAAIGKVAGAVGTVLKFVGGQNSISENLLNFSASSEAAFLNQVKTTAESASNIFDTGLSNNIESTLNRIGDAVNKASTTLLPEVKIDPKSNSVKAAQISAPIDQAAFTYQKKVGEIQSSLILLRQELELSGQETPLAGIAQDISALPDAIAISSIQSISQLEQLKLKFQEVKTAADESITFIVNAVQTGLTNAISNGVQSLVTALTTGENAFKAFAGAALSVVGDLMIQIGTQIVLTSKAIQALSAALLNPLGGAGLGIAAGIGLIAAGIFVKGIAGKLGGKQSAPGGSLTAPGTPATPVSGNVSDNLQERQSAQIVINGDLLDADSTGLRIANILKEQGFANAVLA